jgi:UDPglucose 6-dehydrogenase
LRFTSSVEECGNSEIIFVALDTPVHDDDTSDTSPVLNLVYKSIEFARKKAIIVITSQLPVGSCRKIIEFGTFRSKELTLVYHPENLRLGKAFETFFEPDRLCFGSSEGYPVTKLDEMFGSWNRKIFWVSFETAEMAKHAINCFLALSVAFAGEIAELCESNAADAEQLELLMKSDLRIGNRAYLSPGLGFSGGTLARDVVILSNLQRQIRASSGLISTIIDSNRLNNSWILNTIVREIPSCRGNLVFFGVSYVEGTDTLRRSIAVETMNKLSNLGFSTYVIENAYFHKRNQNEFERFPENFELQIDALIILKHLEDFPMEGNFTSQLIQNSKLILDPQRILTNFPDKIFNANTYRTVGIK